MANLLRSNLKRMIKHPVLWTFVALQIILTFIITAKSATTPQLVYNLDYIFCSGFTFYGFTLTEILVYIMGALIIGGDYQYKTLRNKVIIGYSRESIFFAQFITVLTASMILFASRLLYFCVFSIPVLQVFCMRSEYLLAVFFIMLFSMVMYSAFVTFVMSLTQSMTKTLVICFAVYLTILFLFVSGLIPPQYNEADYLAHSIISAEDYMCMNWGEGGNGFYKFLYDFFPAGQSVQVYGQSPLCLWQILLYLGLQSLAFLTGGALIFRYKNLK